MKPQKNKKFRFVLKKSSPVTKAAILTAVILSTLALVALYSSINAVQNHYELLRQQAMELESGNITLQENIEDLGSLESAIRIAMEELGLEFPDSVIIVPED